MKYTISDDIQPLTILQYFSIFRHPLRAAEVLKFCGPDMRLEDLTVYLDDLAGAGVIRKAGDFYLYNNDETAIEKRRAGEAMAARKLPRAKQVGRWISAFPFVKFVGISGSLSKGYADEKTDFDYFIITASNTLWICRTLLHIVKKLSFLAGKQHWMCMNYFIDERHLCLEEQNLFTQIELSTLIPLGNLPMYRLLLEQNKDTLPNLPYLLEQITGKDRIPVTREKNKAWKGLNLFLMWCTDRKWKHKWKRKGYPMEDYPLAFKTTPYISKNHPKNYQKMILKQLQKNLS